MTLNEKIGVVIDNCHAIDKMRNDRSTEIVKLDNLYEETVKVIIDITPDVTLNQWMDGKIDDREVMIGLNADRHYAETFIEEAIRGFKG